MDCRHFGARVRVAVICFAFSLSPAWAQSLDTPDALAISSEPALSVEAAAALAAFRSITVSWMPPLENTDGSSLTNLTGYRIYAGSTRSNLAPIFAIRVGLSRFVIPVIAADAKYLAMTSLNARGAESALSEVVSIAHLD